MEEEDLLVSKLASGDRPSVYCAGMVVAQAFKHRDTVVLMTDVLGRIHIVPPEMVRVERRPRLRDEELDTLSEDEAIALLVKQGDDEDTVLGYLKRRSGRAA